MSFNDFHAVVVDVKISMGLLTQSLIKYLTYDSGIFQKYTTIDYLITLTANFSSNVSLNPHCLSGMNK
jgi:hypothetical protein